MEELRKKIIKNKGSIILVGALLIVMIMVFVISVISNKNYFVEISYDKDYEEIIKGEAIVYFSYDESKKETIKNIANRNKILVNYIDANAMNDGLDVIEVWKNNEKIREYNFGELNYDENVSYTVQNVTMSEYFEKTKESNLNLLVVGSSSCGYCTKFKTVIASTPKIAGVGIYYLDLTTITQDEYNSLIDSDSYFKTKWGTPTTMIYSNGQRIDYIDGYVEADALLNILEKDLVLQFLLSVK